MYADRIFNSLNFAFYRKNTESAITTYSLTELVCISLFLKPVHLRFIFYALRMKVNIISTVNFIGPGVRSQQSSEKISATLIN